MGKALIVYFSSSEKGKQASEEKVVLELEKLFSDKKISVKKLLLEPKQKLSLNEQFKQEKDLELKQSIGQIKEFDFVIIGSPIVGSFTSAPLINLFIRTLPKFSENENKPLFVLFATGIIPGFGIKKMQSLLSMKGIKPAESTAFTSIFEFDDKKMAEVKKFFENIFKKS
ncbi:MAG: hypothetical protein WC462_02355 [archaeon]